MAGYEVARADPARDRDQILSVWKRNLAAHDAGEHEVRYDWICRSPVGPPRFWLIMKDGEAVGTAGLALRRVSVDGDPLLAGIAGDFAVDARHRMLQPAMLLQKAVLGALEDGLDLVYGLPNKNALKVFERQGYHTLGGLARYVKVLRTGRFLRASKGRAKALAPLSPLADMLLRLRSPETWRRNAKGRSLGEVNTADGRLDDLWSRVAAREQVIGVRTADFFRWRYADCPLQKYSTVALADDNNGRRLLGYVTWYAGDDEQLRVADLVTDGSEGAAEDLLAELIARGRAAGAASISCEFFGAVSLGAVLRQFRFVERECEARLAVSAKPAAGDNGGGGLVQKCRSWYFLRGDENVNTL